MKKLNKLFAILVAMAMVLSLTAISAFAVNPATSATAGEGVDTKIVKAIQKPDGLSGLPSNTTYQFKVSNATLGDETITLTDNTKLTSDDILAAYLTKTGLTAGKYTFTVTEIIPEATTGTTVTDNVVTKTIDGEKYTTTETYTYSKAVYEVNAIIATDTAANGTVTYYVQQSAVTQIKDDAGATVTENAKPSGGDSQDAVEFTFTNKYNKKITNKDQTQTTEENDPTTLKIKKTVTDADTTDDKTPDANQEFKFKATIAFPANSTETKYTATVKDANGVVAGADKVEFTNGVATVFTLKANQYLSFDNIEVGAKVTSLTEDSYPGFTPSGTITQEADQKTISDAAAGNAITVDNSWDASSGSVTGILMSNLPYIVLALVAIGGLCAYVVVRRKNADEA